MFERGRATGAPVDQGSAPLTGNSRKYRYAQIMSRIRRLV
jgi:hypothetical protein